MELISHASQSNEAASEALMCPHQEATFRLAYLFMGDPKQAEDVVQEAFLRAFYTLPRFDLQRPIRPWLLGITANLARNQLRFTRRYLSVICRFWQNEPVRSVHPEIEVAQNWMTETLWQAVRRLGRRTKYLEISRRGYRCSALDRWRCADLGTDRRYILIRNRSFLRGSHAGC